MGKNKNNPFNNQLTWEDLGKMLKTETDKLARRQRAFREKGIDSLDNFVKNNYNEHLFKMTDKGYISKGTKYYKDLNKEGLPGQWYLRKAIKTLQQINNNENYKSVKQYNKIQEKKERSIQDNMREKLKGRLPNDQINKMIKDKGFMDRFYKVMNNNAHSKYSSDQIMSDFLNIEMSAFEKAVNQIVSSVETTQRLYNRGGNNR